MSRSYHPAAPHHYHSTLSALSSAFRSTLGAPTQSVSVVVKNTAGAVGRADDAAESSEGVSDEEETGHDGRPRRVGRVIAERGLYYMPMALSSSRAGGEYSSAIMSGETTSAGGRGTKRLHTHEGDGDGDLDTDTPRKHGKRLTTKEEVSLFEICNSHATSFGHRSNLCNWWKTVTAEFTRAHGHPYSWHSVRRKVELVTKQRIKFLEGQMSHPGSVAADDVSNPQWRAAVDEWIPTWRRWEEAEARRIEKRDSCRSRRRKKIQSWDLWATTDADGWRFPPASSTSPVGVPVGAGTSLQASANTAGDVIPTTPATTTAAAPPPLSPSSTPTTVKLPPGFESMFSNPPFTTQTISTAAATAPSPDYNMVSAVLETLGKFNKHLDAASANGGPDPRSSAAISALVSSSELAAQNHSSPQPAQISHSHPQPPSPPPSSLHQNKSLDIESLKEELRQDMQAEMRRELERDRAVLEEKLDSVQRTQEMILEMLRQEPA